jgi:hypothetical protein
VGLSSGRGNGPCAAVDDESGCVNGLVYHRNILAPATCGGADARYSLARDLWVPILAPEKRRKGGAGTCGAAYGACAP